MNFKVLKIESNSDKPRGKGFYISCEVTEFIDVSEDKTIAENYIVL